MFGAGEAETLVLNANNKLVKYILDNPEGEYNDMICNQLYDLAVLANKPLSVEDDSICKTKQRSAWIVDLI